MSDEVPESLHAVARAIAEGEAVAWSRVEVKALDDRDAGILEELRHLEAIAIQCAEYASDHPPSAAGASGANIGTSLGTWAHFDLLTIVGQGTHGTVYRARDRHLDREVALKLLTTSWQSASSTEGLNLARVRNRHVVTVFGALVHDGVTGLWMEFIQGPTLEEIVATGGPMRAPDVRAIAIDLCDALSAVHAAGLVHRDIKAQNTMREAGGRIVLMDLGASRAHAHAGTLVEGTGTPLYMAPELFAGLPASVASDIYALGVLLFRLATGHYPIPASTVQEIRLAHAHQTSRSLRDQRPDFDARLATVVDMALSAEPDERFHSVQAMQEALTPIARPIEISPRPPSGPYGRLPWLLLTLGIATLTIPLVMRSTRFAGGWAIVNSVVGPSEHGASAGSVGPDRVSSSSAPLRVAVLPFENLGRTDDAYFADGVADEIRGRLSNLSGVEVIARGTSIRYRGSVKPFEQIAKELGVRFLLTGTVRWDKRDAIGSSRVRVSPELVEVSEGQPATSRWEEPYDRALTDVFQIQADIANQVAAALGAKFGDSDGSAAPPTGSLPAYDAYLRGEEDADDFAVTDAMSLRRAIGHYEEAVSLDASFAAAWTQLARARANLYAYITSEPKLAEGARQAAERTRVLEPNGHRSALALGDYYSLVTLDNVRAGEVLEAGLQVAPGNVTLQSSLARTEMRLGRWERGMARLTRTLAIDPQSMFTWRRYALALILLRRYDEARDALARAQALSATNLDLIQLRAMLALAEGDISEARALVQRPPQGVNAVTLGTYVASVRQLYWLLDPQQQLQILELVPAAFGSELSIWAMVRTQLRHMRGEAPLTREAALVARDELQRQLNSTPDDGRRHVYLGLALAYLGLKREAMVEGRHALSLVPTSRDAFIGPDIEHQFVRICILVGERDTAIDHLEHLLAIPHDLSAARLRVDPTFLPLHGHPRYERLAVPASGER